MELDDLLRQASLNGNQVADLLRAIANQPWGVAVPAVVPAGATSVAVVHGLGRAFNGAAVVGQSNPAVIVSVSPPTATAETTLIVRLSAAAGTPTTVLLRVY